MRVIYGAIVLIMLGASATSAQTYLYDQWVSAVRIEPTDGSVSEFDPVDPVEVRASAEVITLKTGSIPQNCMLRIEQFRGPVSVNFQDVSVSPDSLQTLQATFDVLQGDRLDATVDFTNVVTEVNERNNTLSLMVPGEFCGGFPTEMEITDPQDESRRITVQCGEVVNSMRKTYHWPVAMIIVPPYNNHPLVGASGAPPCQLGGPDAAVETTLSVTSGAGAISEGMAGITASAAIESEFEVPLIMEATIGLEIYGEMETAFGEGWERARSESFGPSTTTGTGWEYGYHTVVISQTDVEVAQYKVTTQGPLQDKLLWVGRPPSPEADPRYEDNPQMDDVDLTTYDFYRHRDAPELRGGKRIGDMKTYRGERDYDAEAVCHIPNLYRLRSASELAVYPNAVRTARSDGCGSIERSGTSTTTVTAGVNAYAEADIGGATVRASFGAYGGFSHQLYETKTAEYCYAIERGACEPGDHDYYLMLFATNLRFEYETLDMEIKDSALLLIDFWIDEWPLRGGAPLSTYCSGFVGTPPTCDANGPYMGIVGHPVQFDGRASTDPEGAALAIYLWDFGDGSQGWGPTPVHAYTLLGYYPVHLSVTDIEGFSGECWTHAVIYDFRIWSDNFDSYPRGSGLIGQGGWEGWDLNPVFDAQVTDVVSHSAPHSVEILPTSDVVNDMGGGYDSGQWMMTGRSYVPGNAVGQQYFIMLNQYVPNGTQNWSTQILLDSDANEVRDLDGLGVLPLIRDQWVELSVEIDLDADTQTVRYDGAVLFTDSWTGHVAPAGTPTIGAVDLFSNGGSSIYWDDLSISGHSGVTSVEETVARVLPKRLVLHTAQPNPFNPSTTIGFDLPEAGRVRLTIYDVSGRPIRTLVDAALPRDYHSMEWDGRDGSGQLVGAGVYIYRLEAGDQILSKKMVLVK